MKAVKFKEQNCTFAENQPEYLPMPACKINDAEGTVIECWRLTFSERIWLLITGRLWVALLTFHKPLTPQFFTVKKRDLFGNQKQFLIWRTWVKFWNRKKL